MRKVYSVASIVAAASKRRLTFHHHSYNFDSSVAHLQTALADFIMVVRNSSYS